MSELFVPICISSIQLRQFICKPSMGRIGTVNTFFPIRLGKHSGRAAELGLCFYLFVRLLYRDRMEAFLVTGSSRPSAGPVRQEH